MSSARSGWPGRKTQPGVASSRPARTPSSAVLGGFRRMGPSGCLRCGGPRLEGLVGFPGMEHDADFAGHSNRGALEAETLHECRPMSFQCGRTLHSNQQRLVEMQRSVTIS